jgi:deoxyadenosine/deoxycytidine kinase
MYIVEGNIGAGKSTFLSRIAQKIPYIDITYEPAANWQTDATDESLLKNFYHSPERWAYTMETLTMIYRVRNHLNEQKNINPYRVMERSIYSGYYVFGYNDYHNGFMDKLEWSLYNEWFNFLIPLRCTPPLGFIYLHTTPEVALERIKKRSRSSETTISIDYLNQIDQRHQEFLIKKNNVLPELMNVPVLALDCDEDVESNPQALDKHMPLVEQFITTTSMTRPINPIEKTA